MTKNIHVKSIIYWMKFLLIHDVHYFSRSFLYPLNFPKLLYV